MKFFKREPQHRPFSYPVIVEERKNSDKTPIVIGVTILVVIAFGVYFLFFR